MNEEKNIQHFLPEIAQYFIKEFGKEYASGIRQRIADTVFLCVDNQNADKVKLVNMLDAQLANISKDFCTRACQMLNVENPLESLSCDELKTLKYFNAVLSTKTSDEDMYEFAKFLGKLTKNSEISQKNVENFIKNDKNKEIITSSIQALYKLYNNEYATKIQHLQVLRQNLLHLSPLNDTEYGRVQNEYSQELRKVLSSHLSIIFGKDVDKNTLMLEDFENYLLKPISHVSSLERENLSKQLQIIAKRLHISLNPQQINKTFWEKFESGNIRQIVNQLYAKRNKALKLIPNTSDNTLENIDNLNIPEQEKDILKTKIAEYVLDSETEGFSFHTKTSSGENTRICVLPPLTKLNDAVIFHEISHIVNSPLSEAYNGKYTAKSGFTLYVGDENMENKDLDEIITDYFALKTQKIAKNDNFQICHNRNELSSYSCAFLLFQNFLEKYKKDIIKCRMSDDPNIINRTFGEENVEALAFMASEFLKLVDGENQNEIVAHLEEKFGFNVEKVDVTQKGKSYYEKQYLKFAKLMQDTLENIKEHQSALENEDELC